MLVTGDAEAMSKWKPIIGADSGGRIPGFIVPLAITVTVLLLGCAEMTEHLLHLECERTQLIRSFVSLH
jgi:hypothetical protein